MGEIPEGTENGTPQPTPIGVPARPRRRPSPGILMPLLLIFVGVLLLLGTTGVARFNFLHLVVLWPVLLVLIGLNILFRHSTLVFKLLLGVVIAAVLVGVGVYMVVVAGPEASTISLDRTWPLGEVNRGDLNLDMAVGQITLEDLGESTSFAEAGLQGWFADQEPRFDQSGGVASLRISQGGNRFFLWPGSWPLEPRWRIALTPRVPLRIQSNTGVGEVILRLNRLQVEDLKVDVGVGKVEVTLPAGGGAVRARIDVAIGAVDVWVPEGAKVQIRADAALGRVSVNEARFRRTGDLYRSPGCDLSTDCLDLEIDVAIGSIQVR